ncbi:MAG: alginate export family protein [Marinomonas gallaica]
MNDYKHCMTKKVLPVIIASAMATSASAYNVYEQDGTELNLDIEAIFGMFSSDHNYGTIGEKSAGSSSWKEGYIKYGFSGSHTYADSKASVYGSLNAITSGTWGDGDAAGFSKGNERETDLEDAFVGWRSGNLMPALGQDGLDISFGRQNFVIGDGFLINGDGLNFGNAFDGSLNRGGGYWLAPRKAFDQTAVVRIGGSEGARADVFWLDSDNVAQNKMELAGINAEYVTPESTLGTMYIKGLDAEGNNARDGQETISLRYQGNAGVENLFLSGEYVTQESGDTGDNADSWYVEAGWTFSNVAWSPSVNYRYAQFDDGFDPLFYGFNRGYGTWFQGEVAANFAGPFNTGSDIQQIAIKANPTDTLTVGALLFDFGGTSGGMMDAQELDIYAEWVVAPNLIISPLVGLYSPDNKNSVQLGDNDTNVYGQIIAIVPF